MLHISDDELLNLPDDPELALSVLDDKLRKIVGEDPSDPTREEYVRLIEAFVETNEINIDLPGVPSVIYEDFNESYLNFITVIDNFKNRKRFSEIKRIKEGSISSVQLEGSEKALLHQHISKIREIIEDSGVFTRKKNASLTKLNALAVEIDRAGTKTDMFLGLYLDACLALGQGAEYAKPFLEEVKSVLRIIASAKARNEGVALPPATEVPLIGKELKSKLSNRLQPTVCKSTLS